MSSRRRRSNALWNGSAGPRTSWSPRRRPTGGCGWRCSTPNGRRFPRRGTRGLRRRGPAHCADGARHRGVACSTGSRTPSRSWRRARGTAAGRRGDCEHLRGGAAGGDAPNRPAGCEECLRDGTRWVHLRLCLACGHVGCCDSSVGKHATGHFRRDQPPGHAQHRARRGLALVLRRRAPRLSALPAARSLVTGSRATSSSGGSSC